jgi:phytoene dehydrogenase-like protein
MRRARTSSSGRRGVPDAIIIGAGPNRLVAANLLADAGWDVLVLGAASTQGGAVRTDELTLPGFRHDTFGGSIRSPSRRRRSAAPAWLPYGLRWRHGSPAPTRTRRAGSLGGRFVRGEDRGAR